MLTLYFAPGASSMAAHIALNEVGAAFEAIPLSFHKVYAIADARLDATGWATGDYSIADIHLFRLFWRFAASLQPPPGSFPRLEAHHARMMARPAVIQTIATEAAVGYELPT